jgi:hypothetical protein
MAGEGQGDVDAEVVCKLLAGGVSVWVAAWREGSAGLVELGDLVESVGTGRVRGKARSGRR